MAELKCNDGTVIKISDETEMELRKAFEKEKKYRAGTRMINNDGAKYMIIRDGYKYALLDLEGGYISGKANLGRREWANGGSDGVKLSEICQFPKTKTIIEEGK